MSDKNVTVRKAYRQGELLFIPLNRDDIALIESKPTNTSSLNWKKMNSLVIREGEVTGHTHEVVTKNPGAVTLFEPNSQFINGLDDMDSVGNEDRMLVANEPVNIVHPEHKPLNLPKGRFLVVVQREYDETKARRVMD
jgi:hypothetical protein